jgi:LmbE family N-acetylglucosaminyl deacetylase
MRWVYISPHLDDAVLSAGGLMYEQVRSGKKVEIWTMICGIPNTDEVSPFAHELHAKWGFHSAEETVRSRREENRLAAKIVGATDIYLDFLDSIYRRNPNGGWLYENNTFTPPHAEDADLPRQMVMAMNKRLMPDDKVVCPLAIGGHVDHVIVRQAVESLGRDLLYYADIPYLLSDPSSLNLIKQKMQASKQKISIKGLLAWVEGAAAYDSQISMEFESHRNMRLAIVGYGWLGVRLWSNLIVETLNQ